MSELSARFGVSRKTAYKWVERYRSEVILRGVGATRPAVRTLVLKQALAHVLPGLVLFGGGTKRRQQRDIDRAKKLLAEYKARKAERKQQSSDHRPRRKGR